MSIITGCAYHFKFHVKQKYLFEAVSRETFPSGEEHIYVANGQAIVERKIDAVSDQLRDITHGGVNGPRRDEHALRRLVIGKEGGVDHRGRPHGEHGHPQRRLA